MPEEPMNAVHAVLQAQTNSSGKRQKGNQALLAQELASGLKLTNESTTPGDGQATPSASTRKRYVRVHTLHMHTVKELAPGEVNSLMQTWHQSLKDRTAQASTPSAVVDQTTSGDANETAKLQYTLMKRKRSSQDVIAEEHTDSVTGVDLDHAQQPLSGDVAVGGATSSPDAFQSLLSVVDVHAHDPNEQQPSQKRQKAGISQQVHHTASQAAPTEPKPPAVDYDALLRAHFMPMLDDFLGNVGEDLKAAEVVTPPVPQATPESASGHAHKHYKLPSAHRSKRAPPASTTHTEEQQQQVTAAIAEGASGAAAGTASTHESHVQQQQLQQHESDEDMVYDVYLPVEDEDWLDAPDNEAEVPVIEVPGSDDEEFWASCNAAPGAHQPEDWDHDSEDSNAESYYANSYPEDEDGEGSEDEWRGTSFGGEKRSSRKHSQSGAIRWTNPDDEEYDVDEYDSDENACGVGGFDCVTASRKAAQAFLRAALERRKHDGSRSNSRQQQSDAMDM